MDTNIEIIKKETTDLTQSANGMVVTNGDQYGHAATFLKGIKALQSKIREAFDPIVTAAHQAHKVATTKRGDHLLPTVEAERLVKKKMVAYANEQERIQQEEQAKLDRQAAAEEKRKQDAIDKRIQKAEESGKEEKAEELRDKKEEISVEAPIAAARTQKVSGIVYKTVYYAGKIDFALLPDTYKLPNTSMINKMIQAGKGKIPIPGVQILDRKELASGSK